MFFLVAFNSIKVQLEQFDFDVKEHGLIIFQFH